MQTQATPFVLKGDTSTYRPRISRETRRLLMTACIAVLTLWVLARIRFPDRAATPNPVPPLLTQLASPPRFSDLALAVDAVRMRLAPLLVAAVPAGGDAIDAVSTARRVPALRIDDEFAVAILDPPVHVEGREMPGLIAVDPASDLALIRVERATPGVLPLVWQPQRLDEPRYVIVSSSSPTGLWLHPAFISALNAAPAPAWNGPVWPMPAGAGLSAGSVVFTEDGELVGIVASHESGVAIVPASQVLSAAAALRAQPPQRAAAPGIDVQPLTPALATASASDAGVVVTWVDPSGPLVRDIRPGDVILAVDGIPIRSVEQWRVRMARLAADDTPIVRLTRGGAEREIQFNVAAPPTAASTSLGLSMRPVARVGVEVVHVEPGSAAAAADIRAGDVVTAIGAIDVPTAGQVQSAFASTASGEILIAAVTRGATHHVMGLRR